MKLFIKITILLFLAVLIFSEIETGMVLKNDFAKLISNNESIVKIDSFKFYKKRRNFAALNVTYSTMIDINTDDDIRIKVAAFQFKGNEYKKTVVDFTVGICTLYRANKFDALSLIKDSNLTNCPFPKGGYYINDVAPTSEFLPPFFPEGKWLLDLSFLHHEIVATRIHWMMTILKNL